MLNYRSVPALGGSIAIGVILAFLLYLIVGVGRVEPDDINSQGKALSSCIDRFRSELSIDKASVPILYSLNGFCFDSIGSQLKLDQEKIRRDNFLFQRNEN